MLYKSDLINALLIKEMGLNPRANNRDLFNVVYLTQAAGFDRGYFFQWGTNGRVVSANQEVSESLEKLAAENLDEELKRNKLDKESQKLAARLKKEIEKLTPEKRELLVSVHFLYTKDQAKTSKGIKEILEKWDRLYGTEYIREALQFLKKNKMLERECY